MRIASVGSGSQGNGTLVASEDTLLLVDCGFNPTQLMRRMEKLGSHPSQITALLVTHEHSDHICGVAAVAKKFRLPVFLTSGSAKRLPEDGSLDLHFLLPGNPCRIGTLDVLPVPVPHDALEPVQYLFSEPGCTLGILTDLGHVSDCVATHFTACDALLLEFNHDQEMLLEGPYPQALKSRVGGPLGHLNNEQALGLLECSDLDRLQLLFVGHVSQKNNDIALVSELLKPMLAGYDIQVTYASQKEGFNWAQPINNS